MENDFERATFLMEILSSSSSSDEEDIISKVIKEKNTIPKIRNIDIVHNSTDNQFRKNFRLNRETTYDIINMFENSRFCPSDMSHGGTPPISAETHILSFLWFAGNKVCLRDVAERFGIGVTSLYRQINRVIEFLLDIGPEIIKMPEEDIEKQHLANEFLKIAGFPSVLGCIDGSYINIRTPAHRIKSTYCNRHDLTSMTLQAICDYKNRFIDVFTGTSGKIHDARVLMNVCQLYVGKNIISLAMELIL